MKINGWLFVDKPVGVSSRKVVDLVSRSLSMKKVGHAGTLDPMASGLLPIAIGEATKTVGVVQELNKCYEFTVKWGEKTSTDDKTGLIISSTNLRPTLKEIQINLIKFFGNIKQIPPNFSAIKVKGIRAYSLARDNKSFTLIPRNVCINELKVKKYIDKDYCSFKCFCSKGTYVRSLARDLGNTMNCFGHIYELRRTQIGNFSIKNAILLDLSKKLIHSSAILKKIFPIDKVLEGLPSINLTKKQENGIRNGQKFSFDELIVNDESKKNYFINSDEKHMICKYENEPVCFFKIDGNFVKPIKIFNL